jgi:hypothetical protein
MAHKTLCKLEEIDLEESMETVKGLGMLGIGLGWDLKVASPADALEVALFRLIRLEGHLAEAVVELRGKSWAED